MELTELLTIAYGVMGAVSICGYFPQMVAFWKNPMLCVNTPLSTWIMWATQTIVFFIYAVVVNHDPMFIASTTGFMLATCAGLGLQLYGRWYAKHKMVDRRRYPSAVLPSKVEIDRVA